MATRRQFLAATTASLLPGGLRLSCPDATAAAAAAGFSPRLTQVPELAGRLGLVSASLSAHLAGTPGDGRVTLLDFPGILRHELDLTVADLNTMNFPSLEPAYVEKLRTALDASGCVATNLKMNQRVDMASADAGERAEAMRLYRASVDAAVILGCRWVRPLPRNEAPDPKRLGAAFDELIDYAGERGITVLIENFGWMMDRPTSVIDLADAIGNDRVAIGPDTGNWTTNQVRYPALEKTFPRAVTCDFKAKGLGPNGEHDAYDLKRCFDIGWDAGFRGPWCFEYGHADRATAFRGIAFLRDSVRKWMEESADAA